MDRSILNCEWRPPSPASGLPVQLEEESVARETPPDADGALGVEGVDYALCSIDDVDPREWQASARTGDGTVWWPAHAACQDGVRAWEVASWALPVSSDMWHIAW